MHAAPPSLAEQRQRHHVAASRWNALIVRHPRVAWGYLHLVIKAVLHLIEWVLESPPRLLTAIVFIVIIAIWG
jgi:hypothetical protein